MNISTNLNFEECGQCHVNQAATMELRFCYFMQAGDTLTATDSTNLGSLAGVNTDALLEIINVQRRKQEELEKKHQKTLQAIERMRAEYDRLGKELATLEKKMGGVDAMAAKVGIVFDGSETKAQRRQQTQDAYAQIILSGGSLGADQQEWYDKRLRHQAMGKNLGVAEDLNAEIKALPPTSIERGEKIEALEVHIEQSTISENLNLRQNSEKELVVSVSEKETNGDIRVNDITNVATVSIQEENVTTSKSALFSRRNSSTNMDVVAEGNIKSDNMPCLREDFACSAPPDKIAEKAPIVIADTSNNIEYEDTSPSMDLGMGVG